MTFAHLLVVQISPANTAHMYKWNVVHLKFFGHLNFTRYSAATEFRCGGRFYFTLFRSLPTSTNPKVKKYWNRSTSVTVIVKRTSKSRYRRDHRTMGSKFRYLSKFNRTTLHSCHVCCRLLAGLICTSNKWANYRSWQFLNGNWLICWTPAVSFYTTAQLMCWHVI